MSWTYFTPTDFTQFWIVVSGSVAAFGSFVIATQFIILIRQMKRAQYQMTVLQNAESSKIFLEVMNRWKDVYGARNRILATAPVTLEALVKKYGDDPSELLVSKEWKDDYRPVLNFFEFLGVFLSNDVFDQKSIRAHIFTLVTVDAFADADTLDADVLMKTGAIYIHLSPYLEYLRTHTAYRADIYEFYDDVLLPKYAAHVIEKRKRDAQSTTPRSPLFARMRNWQRGS